MNPSILVLLLLMQATNEFYRQVYADGTLSMLFKGINMVVLRRHVSYFLFQVCVSARVMLQSSSG